MATDSKLVRRYQAGVERALGLFDPTSEWADFIAYLSRLFKALQEPPPEATLPLKSTIARHLAQCLRPTLPSGVHQKALDVYALIFTNIGLEGLAADLSLYLPGLSHTFAFASLSTRPQLLSLYDDHILELSATVLRPALRALILSLLPGLEEETSEDFERTLKTFNRLREKYSDTEREEVFWQALFLASVTNPNRRGGVLVYLTRYLPKLHVAPPSGGPAMDDQLNQSRVQAITQPEPGLLVRCFATGLQDDQPLIQRGFLDMLVTHLPLQAQIFHHAQHSADLDVLVRAASTVVLKRDMGLNRRLWSWFTGHDTKRVSAAAAHASIDPSITSPDATKSESRAAEYFSDYGLQSMVRGIHFMLSTQSDQSGLRMRPFRIALSLMDRWEIGGPVVEATFIPLIQSLQKYQSDAPSQEAFDEVFRSANVFFDGIEGRLIASQLLMLLERDDLDLAHFVISNFNLEDDEMMKRHVPLLCLCFAEELHESVSKLVQSMPTETPLTRIEKLCEILSELLKLVASNVWDDSAETDDSSASTDWKVQISRFYRHSTSTTKSIMSPLAKAVTTRILARQLCEVYLLVLLNTSKLGSIILPLTSSLETYIGMTVGYCTMKEANFCSRQLQVIRNDLKNMYRYETLVGVARVLCALWTHDPNHQVLDTEMLSRFVSLLTKQIWTLLQPSTPQYHVESVDILWRLYGISADLKLVESTILSDMISAQADHVEHRLNILRFATLWTHSRTPSKSAVAGSKTAAPAKVGDEVSELLRHPLLFLIDTSSDERTDESLLAWLRTLNSLGPVIRVILGRVHQDLTDQQVIALGLQRLLRLMNLARTIPALWQSFCETSGPADTILELCSMILSKESYAPKLGTQSLELIQSLVRGGQYHIGIDFINLLCTQLTASYDRTELQGGLLTTLQAVFSASAEPQAAETLLPVLLDGLRSLNTDIHIDKFIALLCNVVPALPGPLLLASLLTITQNLCERLQQYFSALQGMYGSRPEVGVNGEKAAIQTVVNPERSVLNLLAGMEYILARAHHQVSSTPDRGTLTVNGTTVDASNGRSSGNDQFTVVLCMQDVLKSCANIWLWRSGSRGTAGADLKSLHYMSSKLRSRTRKILENLIEAEPQECLEALMQLWVEKRVSGAQHGQILDLLQTLDGARPKFMMPATFNAIYSRTNPAALDNSQKSRLSITVNAFELIAFLNDYTNALEDDLLDEIWTDCTTFLKEVLANPMPHRQILLKLLEFVSVLCRKMDNTNFGEESRMGRELADNCARLFTAIFTIKPGGLDGPGSRPSDAEAILKRTALPPKRQLDANNALQILYETLPSLSSCLNGSDRLLPIYTGIATNITGPLLHAKAFPATVSPELLALLQTMTSTSSATKAWKKDVVDAFNDAKFFQGPAELVEFGWLPLLRQVVLIDKTIMPEMLGRLGSPAAAGLMFGVGATAARTEADKKTQLTLRRIIMLLLSMETDTFVLQLQQLLLKLQELLTATVDSSPSSTTRSDVYLTLRAIILCFSQSQLSTLWPILDNELRALCADILDESDSKYTMLAKVEGAKLLDLLLLLKPDEFQLHEWLFVTDTMDAIHPPDNFESMAYADRMGRVLPHAESYSEQIRGPSGPNMMRKPWLCTDESRVPDRFPALLSNFFSQLSIRAFESNYSLERIDIAACRKDLIADLFADA